MWAFLFGQQAAKTTHPAPIWIEMDPIAKVRDLQKKESERQRIVQTQQGQKTAIPAPDSFLGERTQTVDRETVSKSRSTVIGQQAKAAESRREKSARDAQKESVKSPALSQLGVPIIPTLQRQAQSDARDSAAQPSAAPQDYIKGLKEGERTALNTREYVFYGYFQRIRQRLDLAWTSSLRRKLYELYRGGRQLASDQDHTTRLLVTLNQAGEIVRVDVVEESGTHVLDDAAVRAFNTAGPFPNPPNGIVDRNGQIQIRWEFVLKT